MRNEHGATFMSRNNTDSALATDAYN